MSKKSFEKIEAGLTEALAFAKRDGYIARARLAGFQAALPTQITTGGVTYVAFTPAELSDFLEAALATVAAPPSPPHHPRDERHDVPAYHPQHHTP